MQIFLHRYIEAIRKLRAQGVTLLRTIHVTFVPGICTFFHFSVYISNSRGREGERDSGREGGRREEREAGEFSSNKYSEMQLYQ